MLLRETLNLTRVALWRGIIQEDGAVNSHEEMEMNVFSRPVGDDLVLSELLLGMNLHTWDYDVSSNPSILKTRKRGGVLCREEECLFKNDCFFKKDELNVIFGKKQDREIITGLEPGLGESPVLRERDRKRSLSPDENTQIGTLNKQNTMIKNSESVRRKLNQMYFIGGASGEVSLTAEKTPVTCHSTQRRGGKKKAVRRLTEQNRQSLITSLFSPGHKRDGSSGMSVGRGNGEGGATANASTESVELKEVEMENVNISEVEVENAGIN